MKTLIIKILIISSFSFGQISPLRSETKPENVIFANAISVYKSISDSEDIKTRINKKEFVLKKIDERLLVF